MKKSFSLILSALAVMAIVSCSKFNDLKDRVDSLESRIEAIEKVVGVLNDNILALKKLAGAGTISSVESADGVYTITLSNGEKIILTQGTVGVGNAPVMSIDKDGYWMVNYGSGFVYITVDGKKVKATGTDGVTPLFGVDKDGYWTVSYDGGKSYTLVLGADGKAVKAVPDGAADSFFSSVTYDKDNGKFTLTLQDGTELTVPVVSDFLCKIEVEGEQEFGYGETRTFNMTLKGVSTCVVTAPYGWQAALNGTILSVTAPQAQGVKSTLADTRTDVNVIAMSASGYTAIAKMVVKAVEKPSDVKKTATELWEEGEEITIDGRTYSKALNGEATFITQAATISANGVYIISPDIECNIENTAAFQSLILIGNESDKRSKVTCKSQIKFTQADGTKSQLVCMNIDMDASALSNYLLVMNSNAALDYVCFESCGVNIIAGKNFTYISSNARSIKELAFIDCDYRILGNNSPIVNIGSSTASYGTIRFENTAIYATSGTYSGFRIFNGASGKIQKLQIKSCSFVNLMSDTSFYVNCGGTGGEISEVTITDNLFFFGSDLTANTGILRASTWPGTATIKHNAVFKNSDGKTFQARFGGIGETSENMEEVMVSAENPFKVFDQAKGIFTVNDSYKGYGAVR